MSWAEELVKARNRYNEKQSNSWNADSELIEIYRNDSSALNPDEVSRAKELEKARDRKNERSNNRYHAQRAAAKGEAQRAAAKGLVRLWTCDVCKSCSFDTFEKAVAHVQH